MTLLDKYWQGVPASYIFILAVSFVIIQIILALIFNALFFYLDGVIAWMIIIPIVLSFIFLSVGVYKTNIWAFKVLKLVEVLMILLTLGVAFNPFLWPEFTYTIKIMMIVGSIIWLAWWLYAFHVTAKIQIMKNG